MKSLMLVVVAVASLGAFGALAGRASVVEAEEFVVPEGYSLVAPKAYMKGANCDGSVMVSVKEAAYKIYPLCRVI